jgi:hypothetical protein
MNRSLDIMATCFTGTHPEFFIWGRGALADPEAMNNLCVIFKSYDIKIML